MFIKSVNIVQFKRIEGQGVPFEGSIRHGLLAGTQDGSETVDREEA